MITFVDKQGNVVGVAKRVEELSYYFKKGLAFIMQGDLFFDEQVTRTKAVAFLLRKGGYYSG